VGANEGKQPLLVLQALGADLGEARRDDADRLDAARKGGLGGVEHERSRQADECQVDDFRDVTDRPVGRHAADGLAVPVDRICRADEVGGQDVPEQLPADRAPPT
jgi:hypothetical protein